MLWDFLLAVGAALANFALAYMGWRVTKKRPPPSQRGIYEVAFFVVGVVGVICIGIAAARNSAVQTDISNGQAVLSTKMNKLISLFSRSSPTGRSVATSPPASNNSPAYAGVTAYDNLTNLDFSKKVHAITAELRIFERDYQNKKKHLVAAASTGETPEQERNNFRELSKQKDALENEEQSKFNEYLPQTRAIYLSLLKRRKEPQLGCWNLEISVFWCGQVAGSVKENPIADAAEYFDNLADALPP